MIFFILGDYPGRAPSLTTLSATSIVSSQPDTESKIYFLLNFMTNFRICQSLSSTPALK